MLPATAFAADREVSVGAAAPTATWDGGPVSGLLISFDDDDTLVKVGDAGSLTVTTAEPDDTTLDIDLYLYNADESGEATGDPLIAAETAAAEETITYDVAPGNYVVRVGGYLALEGFYKGTATLTPGEAAPAEGAAPPPAAPAAPAPQPAPSAKAKSASSTKFSGTSGSGTKSVEIAVVQVKGKKCSELTSKGSFKAQKKCGVPTKFLKAKGTKKWSFKPKKKLKKGSYVLYARAIGKDGSKGPAARKKFSVKK